MEEVKKSDDHYLKKELYDLIQSNPDIFEFIQNGSLDGLWYWDLEAPEHEWMNPRFWELMGYNPDDKEHLASEWQDLIHPEDLQTAMENFNAHCEDPNHPYDQIVRYRHQDDSTVWVRCRGIAIRDESGKPIRMLGAHNDFTEIKRTEELLREQNQEMMKLNWELTAAHDKIFSQSQDLERLNKKLKDLSIRDGLTGLYNRRAFQEHVERSLKTAQRYKSNLSIINTFAKNSVKKEGFL